MPTAYGDNYWVSVLPGAVHIDTTYSPRQINQCYPGFVLAIDVTIVHVEPCLLAPSVQMFYPYTRTWRTIWIATAGITAVGFYCYALYPTVAAVPCALYNQECRMIIPRDWRLAIAHAEGTAATYQAGVCYVKS